MFTNSKLVDYKKISPNKTCPRNHKIDTITIHCVVGQLSVEAIGNLFLPSSRKASSNYGIGLDGRVGMYVEEKDRSWCSSNGKNDHRSVTIEVASDTKHPYAVTDQAFKSLIDLVTDICKRNNIKELKWKADKSLIGQVDKQNMTVHRWFANKSCPGEYLYSRHGEIATEVNKRLGVYNVILRRGNKGSEVKKLQQDLIKLGYDFGKYGADGSYGPATEKVVKQFQKDNKLAQDGIAGPSTQDKIKDLLAKKTNNDYLTKEGFKAMFKEEFKKELKKALQDAARVL